MTTKDYQTRRPLRIFLSYFRPHRGLFLLDISCAFLIAVIDLAFPLISRTAMYHWLPDKRFSIFFTVMALVGEKDVLDTIDAIVLDTLYLQDLQPSQSLTYSVTAPEGTTLAENVGPVTVTIVVTGVTERNVTVTAFNCENVPEGFSAVPVTESLNILLRGLESEMAQITAEDLRITVDLSGITEPGVHTVPVTVQVANYANVGVKGSYQIVVDVERLP